MMASALIVQNLKKDYGHVHAVKNVSFEVKEGEIFGLIGPNGAGKTTTLESILGLTSYDSGTISVFGVDLALSPEEAKQYIGAQLQSSQLPDVMTPLQAIKLCASFYKQSESALDIIDRFHLREKMNANFASLSGGQKQRLSLALAFVNKPKLVILDEPTVGLDPESRKELHQLIAEQRNRGVTIIFTTHYLEEARTLCDRIAFMADGDILAIDTPEALIKQSNKLSRLVIRTSRPLETIQYGVLSCAVSMHQTEDNVSSIETTNVNKTLTDLAHHLDNLGIELVDVKINNPTLDDVFNGLVMTTKG
jgi:ABC-2 type transport system ATP-binding protein